MSIEEVSKTNPDKIIKFDLDIVTGWCNFHTRKLLDSLGIEFKYYNIFDELMNKFYFLMFKKDINQLEINPLAETKDGEFIPLDAKLSFDDNALFRQSDIASLIDEDSFSNALELEAAKEGIKYISLGGEIGCMLNGAGLSMTILDEMYNHGCKPANFMDVGGVATMSHTLKAFSLILKNPSMKVILISIFDGTTDSKLFAQGIVDILKKQNNKIPVIARIEGINYEDGAKIVKEADVENHLRVKFTHDINIAVNDAIAIAKGEKVEF
jgi:succinyl-CoA synthetase beta subunit